MVDLRSTEQRRKIMQSVGTVDTGLEMVVRRVLHAMGYRYRLHRKDLPGKPDIVFAKKVRSFWFTAVFGMGKLAQRDAYPKAAWSTGNLRLIVISTGIAVPRMPFVSGGGRFDRMAVRA
ncbi:hypothetical protein [Pseudomonas gingeri]|uniref:hypothetical protein n=1 Tax=Pseudomonas gingeri TaxID=117681 RepID=UPI0034E97D98